MVTVTPLSEKGVGSGGGTRSPQPYVRLCKQDCDLQVEQETASWWGMGSLRGLAQVQIEFIFLFQPAISWLPLLHPHLKRKGGSL